MITLSFRVDILDAFDTQRCPGVSEVHIVSGDDRSATVAGGTTLVCIESDLVFVPVFHIDTVSSYLRTHALMFFVSSLYSVQPYILAEVTVVGFDTHDALLVHAYDTAEIVVVGNDQSIEQHLLAALVQREITGSRGDQEINECNN